MSEASINVGDIDRSNEDCLITNSVAMLEDGDIDRALFVLAIETAHVDR